MKRTPRLVTILWLVLTGCEPAHGAVKVQTATLPPSAAPSPLPVVSPCATTLGANQQVLARALAASGAARGADAGAASLDDYLPQACLRGPTSAWTIALGSLTIENDPIFEAKWELVHVGAHGETTRFHSEDPTFTAGVGGGGYGPQRFWSFDFEDDGEPEIVFTSHFEGVEKGDSNWVLAFRYDHGAIAPYQPVAGWTDLRDVDKDGRPDAVVDHQAEDQGGCGIYESSDLSAPTLVAHGVHGGFSTTDAFAKATALRACPAKPAAIIKVSADHTIAESDTATNVICARVWGASAGEVVHAIEAGCNPMTCADTEQRPTLPGECFHLQTLISWAKQAPIVTLGDSRGSLSR